MIPVPTEATVWLALGSNLGDREGNLDGALRCLGELPDLQVKQVSSWVETRAMGGPSGQGDYLNGVLQASTTLAPLALLDALQQIELAFGRQRSVHHGARTLDLDLLFYADWIIEHKRLSVPHPALESRSFVLLPMVQLAPLMRLPNCGLSVRERLSQLLAEEARAEPPVHAH